MAIQDVSGGNYEADVVDGVRSTRDLTVAITRLERTVGIDVGEVEAPGEESSGPPAQDEAGETQLEYPNAIGAGDLSRPPSPPSREQTPLEKRARQAQCPQRFKPYMPPFNYGAVTADKIYRSAYPLERNVNFLEKLEVKTLVTLVRTDPCPAYSIYMNDMDITQHKIDVVPNKDGKVSTTVDSICEALMLVMDSTNYPLYIHCNQGRHRTGCLVACLRKVQRWPIEDVLAEYIAYASPKIRPGDITFIESFDPDCVLEYAKANGHFAKPPLSHVGQSSITSIDLLADVLSNGGVPPLDTSSSNVSERSEPSTAVSEGPPDGGMLASSYSALDRGLQSRGEALSKLDSIMKGGDSGADEHEQMEQDSESVVVMHHSTDALSRLDAIMSGCAFELPRAHDHCRSLSDPAVAPVSTAITIQEVGDEADEVFGKVGEVQLEDGWKGWS